MNAKSFILTALLCTVGVFNTTQAAGTLVGNMRDSIYMDVLRHGRVAVGYLCYFPPSSSTNNSIGNDAAQTRRLDAFFESNLKDTLLRFDRATLLGTASIDGSAAVNEALSHRRALFLRDFLNRRYELSSRLPVEVSSIGEDWDGLVSCISRLPLTVFPDRDNVLDIIRQVPVNAGRETALMRYDGGKAYRWLKLNIFPYQRRAFITIIYDIRKSIDAQLNYNPSERTTDSIVARALLTPRDAARFLADPSIQRMPVTLPDFENSPDRIRTILQEMLDKMRKPIQEITVEALKSAQTVATAPLKPDTVFVRVKPDTVVVHDTLFVKSHSVRRPYVVVKSNLLALAGVSPEPAYRTPMPNLELEYLFNRRWSAAFSALYEKFSHARGYDVWHVTAYTLEGRYRLLPDRHYGGLYLGVYARVGDYNFRKPHPDDATSGPRYNDTGYYQEGGLSLGYTLPLARHWVLEAGAAGGYRHSSVKHYTHENPAENWYDYRTPGSGIYLTDVFIRLGYRF
ncbi:MAG: DUF3575 domain-containing protein [Prevotellaceae bacterium]|jgi:hypothetical protein|nr:DUF3575 domain-containing protein [Prevotellaceae bacterium]